MKSMRVLLLAGTILALAAGSAAAAMQKGSSVLGIQITEGNGDFVGAEDSGYLFPFRHPQTGVEAQYWRMMTDEYAMTLAGGFGFARETDNPGVNAPPGFGSFRDSYSTWQFRVGGDRVAKVNDRFHLFAGPGIQAGGAKVKFESGGTTDESPTALRYGLDGRMGVMLNWSENFGMVGQFGHYWALASANQRGAKDKWTASGSDGAMGFFFGF